MPVFASGNAASAAAALVWGRMAGARDYYELDAADHVLGAMPGLNFGEGVGTDDEKDLAALGLNSLDGVDEVTRALAFFEAGRDSSLGRSARFSPF
jgi:hypothetical protein